MYSAAADFADAESLRPALVGADAFVLLVPEVGTPPLRRVEEVIEQAGDRMPASTPEYLVERTLSFNGAPTAEEQRVSPDVATVLGRSPRHFTDWVRRNVAVFRAG